MKTINKLRTYSCYIFFVFGMILVAPIVRAKGECKNLQTCADLVGVLTTNKYDLGKFAKKTLRVEPNVLLTSGNADQLFAYILEQNNLFRVQVQPGQYRVMDKREFQAFQFPKASLETLKFSFDFVTYEYAIKNSDLKPMLLNIARKLISKNGRVLENVGEEKITLVDTGANLRKLIGIFGELDLK